MMQSRLVLDVRFSLLGRVDCERLAHQAGPVVHALHGNYNRGAFDETESPFMIFELVKPT